MNYELTQRPTKRTIRICHDLDESGLNTRYFLQFPETRFSVDAFEFNGGFVLNQLFVRFFDSDIEVLMPLPNIDDYICHVCLNKRIQASTANELVNKVVEEFWNSTFTSWLLTCEGSHRLWHHCSYYERMLNKSYDDILSDWQENPDFQFLNPKEFLKSQKI